MVEKWKIFRLRPAKPMASNNLQLFNVKYNRIGIAYQVVQIRRNQVFCNTKLRIN